MGINLRKKHLIFKESERCESRHERKLDNPATGTPAATGPVKGGLNGKVPTSPAKQKTITVMYVKIKYSFYL